MCNLYFNSRALINLFFFFKEKKQHCFLSNKESPVRGLVEEVTLALDGHKATCHACSCVHPDTPTSDMAGPWDLSKEAEMSSHR